MDERQAQGKDEEMIKRRWLRRQRQKSKSLERQTVVGDTLLKTKGQQSIKKEQKIMGKVVTDSRPKSRLDKVSKKKK